MRPSSVRSRLRILDDRATVGWSDRTDTVTPGSLDISIREGLATFRLSISASNCTRSCSLSTPYICGPCISTCIASWPSRSRSKRRSHCLSSTSILTCRATPWTVGMTASPLAISSRLSRFCLGSHSKVLYPEASGNPHPARSCLLRRLASVNRFVLCATARRAGPPAPMSS
jgi:hypothetical protein